jgi:hypothetical protein
MPKGTTYSNDMLKLVFNAVAIAGIADDASVSALTHLQVGLHTSDPGVGGSQTTNECGYTGYGRIAVVRSAVGWTVTGNSVSPAAAITFAEATGGSETATHFSVGTDASGAGKILYTGTVTPNVVITSGVTPELSTSTAITES